MSTSPGATARHHPPHDHRIAAIASLPVVFAMLAVGVASADLPSGVVRLSPADAEKAGSTIRLLRQSIDGSTLVQVETRASGPTLLAISGDGDVAALADRIGEPSGALTLAGIDGGQLRIQLPGLLAASFAADASWLAVIDGGGGLWRVDAGSGSADRLADGPFVGSPIVATDGTLLLLSVPSVEAPYSSRLVRFEPTGESLTPVSDEELVYAAFPLDDGDLAVVAHEPDGTAVRRLTSHGTRPMTELGPGAVNVAVAGDGRIAFERDGKGIFLLDAPGSAPRSIGAGSRPCFSPNGTALLVRRGGQSIALGVDGSVLASVGELAAFAGSRGCAS
ncbi:MAG: hypothetical protein ACXWL8_00035 [Candidatus Limnocylindria bacterium]